MSLNPEASLKIFLCHSSTDKPTVRQLYARLKRDGFKVWLDEVDILPGQDWEIEIAKAVRNSDVVLVCLSHDSVTKSGFVQKEIKFALNVAEEKPDGVIFIIPARIEDCEVPDKLKRWQWVDLFEHNGYERLLLSLRANSSQKEKTKDYAEEIGTRIQSGLAKTPLVQVATGIDVTNDLDKQPRRRLTIVLRSTGNYNRDKRHIKTVYSTLISYLGHDQFSFQIFENGRGHLIDFPNDATRICPELLRRLKQFSITDEEIIIEQLQLN
jgi:hypothetical protein